jgi:hypothetical protein
VRSVYPTAAELRPDAGERAGMFVHDDTGKELGYVLRTSPVSDSVIGYSGMTDTLVAFDSALHVLGVRIRSSQHTREHVRDVRDDEYFMRTWNGKSWDEVARKTPEEAGSGGPQGLPAWGPAHDRHSLDRARRSAPTKLSEDGRSVSTITRTSYYLRRRSGSPATDLRFHNRMGPGESPAPSNG